MGPVIVAGVGEPGVSPVPVLHGVLQPVQIRPSVPDMELPSVLKRRGPALGGRCEMEGDWSTLIGREIQCVEICSRC